jgi:hypothetical protein
MCEDTLHKGENNDDDNNNNDDDDNNNNNNNIQLSTNISFKLLFHSKRNKNYNKLNSIKHRCFVYK